ncbi:TIGR04570 family membrane protein [Mycoplasma mycoides subsp. capri]|uniref:TIGR04570 family membrane protein n=1 Tax=Mycoplasma mycoides TaxID=2102 RepID=UPI00223FC51B|nr:TIGR04570 family membrane protein [Mycoplasma mycoides]UZK64488.1 TIGR04570 family membrane protein [Mycoplasma mycoides subsp. capri]
MNEFNLAKDKTTISKIFKKIPWFYHLIFFLIGLVVGLLFQFLRVKTFAFPYFFIFFFAILITYCVLFIIISPMIKQNWFIKRIKNEK